MAKELLEIEGKKPQVDIPLNNLELDNENPRLAEDYKGASQFAIIVRLQRK
ncbi:MAG: hypothetical protein V1701_05795 [Planctomycetota bacterium]